MTLPTGRYTLSLAMARQEGFFVPGSRSARNNNPGNLMWDGPRGFAAAHGATHGDTGPHTPMAVFPTLDLGWAAKVALLTLPARFGSNHQLVGGYLGATIEQVIYRYCPPTGDGNTPENTAAYLRNVCAWMGCQPSDVLLWSDRPPVPSTCTQAPTSTIWCWRRPSSVSSGCWRTRQPGGWSGSGSTVRCAITGSCTATHAAG